MYGRGTMRAALLKPVGERRRARRAQGERRGRHATPTPLTLARAAEARASCPPEAAHGAHAAARCSHDRASYACHCGYLFDAQVTTTVTCPHCGAAQAW